MSRKTTISTSLKDIQTFADINITSNFTLTSVPTLQLKTFLDSHIWPTKGQKISEILKDIESAKTTSQSHIYTGAISTGISLSTIVLFTLCIFLLIYFKNLCCFQKIQIPTLTINSPAVATASNTIQNV